MKLKRPAYLPGIHIVEFSPPGYLTTAQFATRVGTTMMSVNRSLRKGKFHTKFLALAPRNGKATVMINYNAAVVPYLQSVPERFRPKDFDENDKEYRPLSDDEWKKINEESPLKKPGPKTIEDGEAYRKTGKTPNLQPMDMHRSNLVHKHLQIEKAAIEVKLAKNQLIAIADVQATICMLVIEIKQAWEAFEVKTAPKVAAVDNVKEVKEIYLKARKEVSKRIEKLRDAYRDGKE